MCRCSRKTITAGNRSEQYDGVYRWLNDERSYDLTVILDDATSEIYHAQLVEEESTGDGRVTRSDLD